VGSVHTIEIIPHILRASLLFVTAAYCHRVWEWSIK